MTREENQEQLENYLNSLTAVKVPDLRSAELRKIIRPVLDEIAKAHRIITLYDFEPEPKGIDDECQITAGAYRKLLSDLADEIGIDLSRMEGYGAPALKWTNVKDDIVPLLRQQRIYYDSQEVPRRIRFLSCQWKWPAMKALANRVADLIDATPKGEFWQPLFR